MAGSAFDFMNPAVVGNVQEVADSRNARCQSCLAVNAPYEGQQHNGAIRYAIAPYQLIGGKAYLLTTYQFASNPGITDRRAH